MIVGIVGTPKSGKSTVAAQLTQEWVRRHGEGTVLIVQITGPIKAFLRELFDWTPEHTDGHLQDLPDLRLLQPDMTVLCPRDTISRMREDLTFSRWGDMYCQQAVNKAVMWVLNQPNHLVIVEDVHSAHDIKAFKTVDATILGVLRKPNDHPQAASFDATLINDNDLNHLREQVHCICQSIF